MNPQVASILGAVLPNQTPVNAGPYQSSGFPTGGMSYGIVSPVIAEDPIPNATEQVQQVAAKPIRKLGKTGTNMGAAKNVEVDQHEEGTKVEHSLTAKSVADFTNATVYGMKAISAVSSGYINAKQYNMQANNKEFAAWQNDRAAKLLEKNTRDVTRAAEADANVYRLQGVKTKAAQRVGQAASGFAVGKGTYRVMLDTTDVRTNYNAAAIMARSMMQNAEIKRQIGTQKATAIINRADAKALKKRAEIERTQGWMNGIAYALQAGASAYAGFSDYYGWDKPKTESAGDK